MWLTGTSLERIDSALGRGPATEVDRLLAEILAGASATEPTPTTCAVCRRDLTRGRLAHSPVLIYSCPEGHGSWLDRAGVTALQRLLQQRAQPDPAPAPAAAPAPASLAERRRRLLTALLMASLAALAFTFVLAPPPPRIDRTVAGPSPMTAEERRYFAELTVLLDDGIANRRHVDSVLKSEASAEAYTAAFEIYRARQDGFLRRLDALSVPTRLAPAHDAIRRAAERQVGFYRDFKDARIRDPRDLPNLLGHPDLRESDYDLHRAWDLIRQTYPVLDPRLAEAIERRLCSFDIV
jgi:Zn-finger nucleic acid-binding protein